MRRGWDRRVSRGRTALAAVASSLALFAAGGMELVPTARAAPEARKAAAGTAEPGARKEALVNINEASLEHLIALPGVGPSLAQRIVDYRKEHGPFKTIEELLNVRGIGEKSFVRLRDRITVGTES